MSREKSPETEEGRRSRVAFGAHRRRLAVGKKDPNYVYYWFNDQQDRLQRAQAAGYEFCTKKMVGDIGDLDVNNQNTDLNSRVSKRVNETLVIYLMRISRKFWEEDQAAKQMEADAVDEAIYGGGSDRVPNSYGLEVKYKPNRD